MLTTLQQQLFLCNFAITIKHHSIANEFRCQFIRGQCANAISIAERSLKNTKYKAQLKIYFQNLYLHRHYKSNQSGSKKDALKSQFLLKWWAETNANAEMVTFGFDEKEISLMKRIRLYTHNVTIIDNFSWLIAYSFYSRENQLSEHTPRNCIVVCKESISMYIRTSVCVYTP